MTFRLLILTLVLFNEAGALGQNLSQITHEKPKEYDRRQVPIPEYIEHTYKSLILLEYSEALASLKKEAPEKDVAYYQAWCHFINGQIFNAYEDINAYLKHPSSNKYYGQILLGKIEFVRLKRHQSIEAFDKAILLEPTKPYAYLEKSRIYALSKNLDEGLNFTNKYIKQFPNESNFYIYIRHCYTLTATIQKKQLEPLMLT